MNPGQCPVFPPASVAPPLFEKTRLEAPVTGGCQNLRVMDWIFRYLSDAPSAGPDFTSDPLLCREVRPAHRRRVAGPIPAGSARPVP